MNAAWNFVNDGSCKLTREENLTLILTMKEKQNFSNPINNKNIFFLNRKYMYFRTKMIRNDFDINF